MHVSQLGLCDLLMIYCCFLVENESSYHHEMASIHNFHNKLKQLGEFYGESELMVEALNLLIESRRKETLELRVRNDIYHLMGRELSSGLHKSVTEWEFEYSAFSK